MCTLCSAREMSRMECGHPGTGKNTQIEIRDVGRYVLFLRSTKWCIARHVLHARTDRNVYVSDL